MAHRLAEFHGVPPAYLAKQLQLLSTAGDIESVKGRIPAVATPGSTRSTRPILARHWDRRWSPKDARNESAIRSSRR
ncbi:MAG: hypothetical protein ACR2H3_14895 [Acidimicrobiales bacterium]